MTLINGIDMPKFTPYEFSENPDLYAHPDLLIGLQTYRNILGSIIYPSPVQGALARFNENHNSMHSVYKSGNEGLSKAIDVFCNTSIFKAWTVALNSNLWGGIGVYFDTKYNGMVWPMLHLDKRNVPLVWFRSEGIYYYPHTTKDFYSELLDRFVIHNR